MCTSAHGPRTVGSEHLMGPELLELGLLGRPELRWRVSAAVSQADVRLRQVLALDLRKVLQS